MHEIYTHEISAYKQVWVVKVLPRDATCTCGTKHGKM